MNKRRRNAREATWTEREVNRISQSVSLEMSAARVCVCVCM